MKNKKMKKNHITPINFSFLIKIFLINYFLLLPFIKPKYLKPLFANNNLTTDYLSKDPKIFYILGEGDFLKIVIEKQVVSLNGNYMIDGQGFINLPRLKKVYVSGLTVNELTKLLNTEFLKYIKEPDINIQVIRYRPVKIFITGEVANPGLHILPGSSFQVEQEGGVSIDKSLNSYFPSLIDAIKKSDGITLNADLSQIEVIRKNKLSGGGGRIKTNIDLHSFFEQNTDEQNLRILDGDAINIPRSINPSIISIKKAIQTNLNPKFINVIVSGRVENPGTIKIDKSSVLNDAIEIAGGPKIIKGPIRYLKYSNDGSIDRRKFNYSKSAKRGTYSNPYLSNGDIIYVGKGKLAASAEVLNEITKPFQSLVTAVTLYEFLSD